MGPVDPSEARAHNPESIRALIGQSILKNGVHGGSGEIEDDFLQIFL